MCFCNKIIHSTRFVILALEKYVSQQHARCVKGVNDFIYCCIDLFLAQQLSSKSILKKLANTVFRKIEKGVTKIGSWEVKIFVAIEGHTF